eukprot:c39119_g1_i1 orf=86-340(+)
MLKIKPFSYASSNKGSKVIATLLIRNPNNHSHYVYAYIFEKHTIHSNHTNPFGRPTKGMGPLVTDSCSSRKLSDMTWKCICVHL